MATGSLTEHFSDFLLRARWMQVYESSADLALLRNMRQLLVASVYVHLLADT